jgi:hypothetical protein
MMDLPARHGPAFGMTAGTNNGVAAQDFADWKSISRMLREDRLLPWRATRPLYSWRQP